MFHHPLAPFLLSPPFGLYILPCNYSFPGSTPDTGSANQLTQVVGHLVGVPEIFHAEADDINEILHQPEQLLGIWPYLQREGEYLVAWITKSPARVYLKAKVFVLTLVLEQTLDIREYYGALENEG